KVDQFIEQLPAMGIDDDSQIYNTNKIEFLEFENMLYLSKKVIESALHREESRGAHFRSDFPDENGAYKKHTILDKNGVVL
ncbi:MAG: succinate dehydrogenase, partial [Campylobacterales bacterium]|nr:succinate dehydrogenase [Campylobacterales bacterium]